MPKLGTAHTAISVFAVASVDQIRSETLNGIEYSVVPVVALKEGVWQGASSDQPELALASEFGKVAEGWNGRPVTLGHPKREGSFVSAGSPSVFQEDVVGILFNTRVSEKKLKTEAWIDKAKVATLSEENAAQVNRIFSGQLVEVSTGLFTDVEETAGVYSGSEFGGIWRNVIPDHLAILPEGTIGACSVADGAGIPRLNQAHIRTLSQGKTVMDKTTGNLGVAALQKLCKDFKGLMKFKGLEGLSNNDTQTAIALAFAALDDQNCYWIIAVFPDSVVYSVNWDPQFYQCSYSIDSSGTVSIGTTVTEVRPVTDFVPVQVTLDGGNNMSVQERVEKLISKGRFNESDKPWLLKLNEEQVEKIEKASEPEAKVDDAADADAASHTVEDPGHTHNVAAKGEAVEEPQAPETLQSYLAKAPKQLQEVLSESIRMHSAAKTKLVKELKGNSRNEFTEAELSAMDMKQLGRLAKLANVPNYAGAAGGTTPVVNETKDEGFTPAPLVFEAK